LIVICAPLHAATMQLWGVMLLDAPQKESHCRFILESISSYLYHIFSKDIKIYDNQIIITLFRPYN